MSRYILPSFVFFAPVDSNKRTPIKTNPLSQGLTILSN
jgi:hypothetical protein